MPAETQAPSGLAREIVKEGPVKPNDFKKIFRGVILSGLKEYVLPSDPLEQGLPLSPIEDEFSTKPLTEVGPWFPNVKFPRKANGEDMDYWSRMNLAQHIREQFAHISATKGLEINSPRTQAIQGVVNKLTEGTNIVTQVVIMKKGQALEAFVMPDGRIFVSQSLINRLDTIDELAAVLAHEVGHLVFNTTFKKMEAGDTATKFGIGWVHEAACDAHSKNLLEKAGFNTLAFSSAIEKISAYERGTIHQSGLSRASASIGVHYFVDSRTSHLPQAQLPGELKSEIKKTNLEIVKEQLEGEFTKEEFQALLSKLYPGDLKEVLGLLSNKADDYRERDKFYNKLNTLKELLYERLVSQGYSKGEAILAVIGIRGKAGREGITLLNSPSELDELSQSLESMHLYPKRLETHQKAFYSSDTSQFNSPVNPLLDILGSNIHLSADEARIKRGIPVNEDSLLNLLKTCQNLSVKDSGGVDDNYYRDDRTRRITKVITNYIDDFILDEDQEASLLKVHNFLNKTKDLGILIDSENFRNYFNNRGKFNPTYQEFYTKIIEAAFKVYSFTIEKNPKFEDVDRFFEEFTLLRMEGGEQGRIKQSNSISNFLRNLRERFDKNKIPDTNRVEIINYIGEKIDYLKFNSNADLLRYLDGELTPQPIEQGKNTPEVQMLQEQLIKFNLKLLTALQLFEKDDDNFFTYMLEAMNNSGINRDQLNRIQLINLCEGLVDSGSHRPNVVFFSAMEPRNLSLSRKIEISNWDKIAKLPFIEAILNKPSEKLLFRSVAEITNFIKETSLKINLLRFKNEEIFRTLDLNLFGEDLLSLILSQRIVENLQEITSQNIPEREFDALYLLLDKHYPDGNNKQKILRELNKRYLQSPDVQFQRKIDYLILNFNRIGPEGMVILAEQIGDIKTYRAFRKRMLGKIEKYLEGSNLITVVALGDFLSSKVTDEFETLIKTSNNDPDVKKQTSQFLAEEWFDKLRVFAYSSSSVNYHKDRQKFVINEEARGVFKSISDIFNSLKNLSPLQRFALAHKALTEHNGAFSSEENRIILANILINSLGLKNGFIRSVLSAAILKGDAKFITFPAANMLSRMLFRSLDESSIDPVELSNTWVSRLGYHGAGFLKDKFTVEEISRLVTSDTREITLFGASLQRDPNSEAAKLAQSSDDRYFHVTRTLQQQLGLDENFNPESQDKESGIDSALEAIIKGVESSGPLGIRTLQLATQFFSFSPEIHKRLSETFDANPGMNKLMFWENLNKLALDELEGRNEQKIPNPAVEEFVQKIRLGKYLGGGSLQTTYAAELRENDEVQAVILKLKNPNIVAFIKEAYGNSKIVLDEIISSNSSTFQEKEYAKVGLMLIDLARKWCIDDINDKTFERDDDLFRQTIAEYNSVYDVDTTYAPDRIFTHVKLKSETLAGGVTANQLLKDPTVEPDVKKEVVLSMTKFFLYQMRKRTFTDNAGKKYFKVHSDPHVGNIMVDAQGGGLSLGIIDRSMYLNLTEKDVDILHKLVSGKNISDFAYSFVEHILDLNNIRGLNKIRLATGILTKLGFEYQRQLVRGKTDKFSLLQTLFSEFSKSRVHQIDVPLNLRLMIRNIAAFQELTKRYGLNLEKIDSSLDSA